MLNVIYPPMVYQKYDARCYREMQVGQFSFIQYPDQEFGIIRLIDPDGSLHLIATFLGLGEVDIKSSFWAMKFDEGFVADTTTWQELCEQADKAFTQAGGYTVFDQIEFQWHFFDKSNGIEVDSHQALLPLKPGFTYFIFKDIQIDNRFTFRQFIDALGYYLIHHGNYIGHIVKDDESLSWIGPDQEFTQEQQTALAALTAIGGFSLFNSIPYGYHYYYDSQEIDAANAVNQESR